MPGAVYKNSFQRWETKLYLQPGPFHWKWRGEGGTATMSNDNCLYYILENFFMAEIFFLLCYLGWFVSGNCFIIFLLHGLWHSPKDCQMLTGQQFQILKKQNFQKKNFASLSNPQSCVLCVLHRTIHVFWFFPYYITLNWISTCNLMLKNSVQF